MDVTRLAGMGRDLQTRVRRFFDTPIARDATPLEICQAVLDDIERHVEPVGRGRCVFPYTGLRVRVIASEADAAVIDAAFHGFAARVAERLAELRCDAPRALDVHLTCVVEAPASWPDGRVFDVAYGRDPAAAVSQGPAPGRAAGPPAIRVTVLKGVAVEPAFSFSDSTVSIGRTADPTDGFGRVRRNRVAFTDTVDGVTETVGRAHARLRFDHEAGVWRLFDEGSSNGTAIVRDGEVIDVPRRDPRGVRLRPGDEIQVGRALLRIDIDG